LGEVGGGARGGRLGVLPAAVDAHPGLQTGAQLQMGGADAEPMVDLLVDVRPPSLCHPRKRQTILPAQPRGQRFAKSLLAHPNQDAAARKMAPGVLTYGLTPFIV
jgi:hypothetical protein